MELRLASEALYPCPDTVCDQRQVTIRVRLGPIHFLSRVFAFLFVVGGRYATRLQTGLRLGHRVEQFIVSNDLRGVAAPQDGFPDLRKQISR